MTPDELRILLAQPEGLKLDFKREYKLGETPPSGMNIDLKDWKRYIEGQKNEMMKDILALANGNVGATDQPGYLIIGVGDKLLPDGTRPLYDASWFNLSGNQLLQSVNNICEPRLQNIELEYVYLGGKQIVVIRIDPSNKLHSLITEALETYRLVDSPGGKILQSRIEGKRGTTFIRVGESVAIASPQDIEAIKKSFESSKNIIPSSEINLLQNRDSDRRSIIDHELRRVLSIHPPLKRIPEIVLLEAEIDDKTKRTLHRSKSLVASLVTHSKKNDILIMEGPPGSGKTIALRQAAAELLENARNDRTAKSPLAVYINLADNKDLDYKPQTEFFEALILRTVGGRFKSFADMLQNRRWVFMFDAFDEIPAVRNAAMVNAAVLEYYRAIETFAKIYQCSVVIASRTYFSPSGPSDWPKVSLQKLAVGNQLQLINKSTLPGQQKKLAVSFLTDQSQLREYSGLREFIASPLVMELFIQYIAATNRVPQSTKILFDEWVTQTIQRDSDSLYRNFEFKPDHVKDALQKTAFCYMQSNLPAISVPDLELALERNALALNGSAADYIRAFESLDFGITVEGVFRFTMHRRVVEFLAAEMLRARPDLGDAYELLTQTNWRDVTVTLLQTAEQLPEHFEAAILVLLERCWGEIESQIGWVSALSDKEKNVFLPLPIIWPEHVYHLFSLLQDGFSGKMNLMPARVRERSKGILAALYSYGSSLDRKHVMQIIGVLPDELKTQMLELAIAPEELTSADEDSLYFQIANLENIPFRLRDWVRTWIFTNANKPSWLFDRAQRARAFAYLARTKQLSEETWQAHFYTWMSRIDWVLVILMTAATTVGTVIRTWPNWWNGLMLPLGFLFYLYFLFYEILMKKGNVRNREFEIEIFLTSLALLRSLIIFGGLLIVLGWHFWWILAILFILALPVTAILSFRHNWAAQPRILLVFSPLVYPPLIIAHILGKLKRSLPKVNWRLIWLRIKYFPQFRPFFAVVSLFSMISLILMLSGLLLDGIKESLLLNLGAVGSMISIMIFWGSMLSSTWEVIDRFRDRFIWKELEQTSHLDDNAFIGFLTGFRANWNRRRFMQMLLSNEKANSISPELLKRIQIALENSKRNRKVPIYLVVEDGVDHSLKKWIYYLVETGEIKTVDWLIEHLVLLLETKT